mmetsp:Transcript_11866/g.33909  ORF Transcript_11866/g.33909 Transcript_11866/m.33909 type:complete len:231 (+) Transcript_11866:1231-1923(+)
MHGSGALNDVQKESSGLAHFDNASSAMGCCFGMGRGGLPLTPSSEVDAFANRIPAFVDPATAGTMNLQCASSPSIKAKLLESASLNASISDGSFDPKQKATLLDPRPVVFSMFNRCIWSSLSDTCVDMREYCSAYFEAASAAARPAEADFFGFLLLSSFVILSFLASFSIRRRSFLSRRWTVPAGSRLRHSFTELSSTSTVLEVMPLPRSFEVSQSAKSFLLEKTSNVDG